MVKLSMNSPNQKIACLAYEPLRFARVSSAGAESESERRERPTNPPSSHPSSTLGCGWEAELAGLSLYPHVRLMRCGSVPPTGSPRGALLYEAATAGSIYLVMV